MSYYNIIRHIRADAGFVVIDYVVNGSMQSKTISVDEALDRAEAIRGLTAEAEKTQGLNRELYTDFLEAVAEARRQQVKLLNEGKYVDFRLKEANVRKLEAYLAGRHIADVK